MKNSVAIQYLRGVAALSVLVFHLHNQLGRMGYSGDWPQYLIGGVDLFFVISGFIMWVTTAQTHGQVAQFYRKRLQRILPLYWIFTTVLVVTALVLPQLLQTTELEFWHALASYFFVPYPSPVDGSLSPILIPGWTLNYEMFFYALFGLCLFLAPGARLVAIICILVLLPVIGSVLKPSSAALQVWTSSLLLEFLYGILIGAAVTRWTVRWGALAGVILMLSGVLALVWFDSLQIREPRFVMLGIPAALIVWGAVLIERAGEIRPWRLPRLLGDASYSIYLSHGLTLSAAGQIWRRIDVLQGTVGVIVFSVVAVAGATLVGVIIYWVVELPMKTLFVKRRTRLVPA